MQKSKKKVPSKIDNSANIFLKRSEWLKILCRRGSTGLRTTGREDEPVLGNISTEVRTIDFKPPPCSEEPCKRKIRRIKKEKAAHKEEVIEVESTSHLVLHFNVKKKEKYIARRVQSRNWFLEKVDWIMNDVSKDEAVKDMTEEDLMAEEKIVSYNVAVTKVKKDVSMVISSTVGRVSSTEDKGMFNAACREGSCSTHGRGPSPTIGRGPSPSFPTHEEISQDGVGQDDPLNNLMALFPLPTAANPPSTSGITYNINDGPSSLPLAPPAHIPPPSLALIAPIAPIGDVNSLLGSPLKFGLITGGSNSLGTGGIPCLSFPGISPIVAAPKIQPTMALAPEQKPQPELKPAPITQYTPKVRLPPVPIRPILLSSHHPSLKERQGGIIELLYGADDLHYKSCGDGFSKEEMPKYTSHLDSPSR